MNYLNSKLKTLTGMLPASEVPKEARFLCGDCFLRWNLLPAPSRR
jgi:hypothetical protein